ncbi:50S ribosomal protein L11 [Spiroplasma sabaudiense Ar-1343]|uniref:Large ribosomal subunit protein uL11 n=1 Tax=Spiroplasma sabaudiense Ar-1343 TaxID=1276257 RepID=W6AIB8_9MOLU|nr:50S ribosomal protein L11 [Spiroplasma sabaudiense Ar-1343]
MADFYCGRMTNVIRLDHSEKHKEVLPVAKKVTRIAKLEFMAMQAKPGAELASLGINMPQFTQQFNDATKDRAGDVVPVVITAYDDKSFDFILKTTPAAILLKKAAKLQKGAKLSGTETVATISADEVRKIAEYKMVDLTANSIEAAMKTIEGTARQMGIKVEGMPEKA